MASAQHSAQSGQVNFKFEARPQINMAAKYEETSFSDSESESSLSSSLFKHGPPVQLNSLKAPEAAYKTNAQENEAMQSFTSSSDSDSNIDSASEASSAFYKNPVKLDEGTKNAINQRNAEVKPPQIPAFNFSNQFAVSKDGAIQNKEIDSAAQHKSQIQLPPIQQNQGIPAFNFNYQAQGQGNRGNPGQAPQILHQNNGNRQEAPVFSQQAKPIEQANQPKLNLSYNSASQNQGKADISQNSDDKYDFQIGQVLSSQPPQQSAAQKQINQAQFSSQPPPIIQARNYDISAKYGTRDFEVEPSIMSSSSDSVFEQSIVSNPAPKQQFEQIKRPNPQVRGNIGNLSVGGSSSSSSSRSSPTDNGPHQQPIMFGVQQPNIPKLNLQVPVNGQANIEVKKQAQQIPQFQQVEDENLQFQYEQQDDNEEQKFDASPMKKPLNREPEGRPLIPNFNMGANIDLQPNINARANIELQPINNGLQIAQVEQDDIEVNLSSDSRHEQPITHHQFSQNFEQMRVQEEMKEVQAESDKVSFCDCICSCFTSSSGLDQGTKEQLNKMLVMGKVKVERFPNYQRILYTIWTRLTPQNDEFAERGQQWLSYLGFSSNDPLDDFSTRLFDACLLLYFIDSHQSATQQLVSLRFNGQKKFSIANVLLTLSRTTFQAANSKALNKIFAKIMPAQVVSFIQIFCIYSGLIMRWLVLFDKGETEATALQIVQKEFRSAPSKFYEMGRNT